MKSLRFALLAAGLLFAGISSSDAQQAAKTTPRDALRDTPAVHPLEKHFELLRLQMGSSDAVEAIIDRYKQRFKMLDHRTKSSGTRASKAFATGADFENMSRFPGDTIGFPLEMPSVLTAPNGDLLAVARVPGEPGSDFFGPPLESPSLLFFRSADGGTTWSDPATIREDGETITAFYFPELRRTPTGRLVVFDQHPFGDATMAYSDDDGATWQNGARTDKPGDRYHPPINGTLWNTYADVQNETFVFVTSEDGVNWSAPSVIVPWSDDFGLNLGSVAQSGSSIVALFFRYFDDGQDLATVTSTDGGTTWGPFVSVPFSANGALPYDAKIEADPEGNLTMVVEADNYPNQLSDVYYITSSDGGASWSAPTVFTLFTGPDYLGEPAFTDDGTLIFFGTDRYEGGIWFGLAGTSSDLLAPPFVDFTFSANGYPSNGPPNVSFPVSYAVSSVASIDHVDLLVNDGTSVDRSPMMDDGIDPDETAGDGVYSGTVPGLDFGPQVTYQAEATDANANSARSFIAVYDRIPVTLAGDLIVGVSTSGGFGSEQTPGWNYADDVQWPGPEGKNFVSLGGLFVGVPGTPARVMHTYWDNLFSETGGDWQPIPDEFPVASDDVSDSDFTLRFNDSGAPVPIGLNVKNSIYQWSSGDETNSVVLRYEIQNVSGGPLNGVVVSLFADVDNYLEFGGSIDDRVGWDAVNGILYMYDSGQDCSNPDYNPDPAIFPCSDAHVGFIILNDGAAGKRAAIVPQTVAKWNWEQDPERKGTSDTEFYNLMTGGIDPALKLGISPPADDYRILVSPDALTIPAGEKVEVAFAIVMGNSPAELATNAAAITDAYSSAPVAAEDAGLGEQPGTFALGQNYPNPFNPSTAIPFSIGASGPVTLTVSDVLGRKVAILVNDTVPAGTHMATFNATALPSGTYFYTLEAGGQVQTKTLFLLK